MPLNDGLSRAPTVAVNRWNAWAASVAARHARLWPRFAPLPLTLVRAELPVAADAHDLSRLWNLCVRARLILGPVLVNLGYSVLAGPVRPIARLARHHRQLPRCAASGAVSHTRRTEPLALKSPAIVGPRVPAAIVVYRPASGAMVRVFTRLAEGPAAQARHGALMQRIREIRERILHEHRRLEEHRPALALRHAGSAATKAPTAIDEMRKPSPAVARSRTRWAGPADEQWAAREKALPTLDVDRLTDQVIRKIDDRVTAFRERLGRAL
jgi:hypothetical protein